MAISPFTPSTSTVSNAKGPALAGAIGKLPLDQNCGCQNHKHRLGVSAGFGACTHGDSTQTDPDDLLNHFDISNFPEEHKLVLNMYNNTANEYPDLCDGTRDNLLVLPESVFHYSKDNTTLNIQSALERIQELENQINKDKLIDQSTISLAEKDRIKMDIFEKEYITNTKNGLITEQAEKVIQEMILECFHGDVGTLFHSYKPETYLKTITDRAKSQRKTLQKMNQFTDLEEKLMDVMGIRKLVKSESNNIMAEVVKQQPGALSFTAESLHTQIKTQKLNKQKHAMAVSNLVKGEIYTFNDACTFIATGLIHFYSSKSGEMDFVLVLAEYKVLMNIEVKYEVDGNKDKFHQTRHLLMEASKQVNEHDVYLARTHSSLLDKNWRMIKVCAILPGTAVDSSICCDNCDVCIITADTLKDKVSRFAWLETLGLQKKYKHNKGLPLSSHYIEYLALCKRLIGSLHSSTVQISCWDKVMGTKSTSSFNPTGDTESQPTAPTWEIVKNKQDEYIKRKIKVGTPMPASQQLDRLWEVEDRPMDAEKSIYLSRQQLPLLSSTSSAHLTTILIAEFGGGNTSYFIINVF